MPATKAKATRRGKTAGERKNVALRVMVTRDEQQMIQIAADRDNRSLSSWVRLVALERAGTGASR